LGAVATQGQERPLDWRDVLALAGIAALFLFLRCVGAID
jgi:hypothetical protein